MSASPGPSRSPRASLIPIPSDRAAFAAHLIALAVLLGETVYWLAQPCVGDFMCAPMLGLYTGAMLIPVAIGVAIWRLAGRASVVVLIDAFFLSVLLPLTLQLAGSLDPTALLLLPGLPLILLFGIFGPIADLGAHRIERRLVIAVLAAASIGLLFLGGAIGVPVPAAIALLLAFTPPSRRDADRAPLAAHDAAEDRDLA